MPDRPNLLLILTDQHNPRVPDGWDGDRIEGVMANRDARREGAHTRAEKFRTPEQDFWDMPPDCNVFPK